MKGNIVSSLRLPSDAFKFGDELYNRAKESVEKESILPLLKDELRCKIQTKRLSQGLDELKVEFEVKPPTPLTEEEKVRQMFRKHNNRYSAQRCRLKKKETFLQTKKELAKLEEENRQLKQQINKLEEEKDRYLSNIVSHPVIKTVLLDIYNFHENDRTDIVYQESYSVNQNS